MSIGSVQPTTGQPFAGGALKPARPVLSPLRPPVEAQVQPPAPRVDAPGVAQPNRPALEAVRTDLERALATGREAAIALGDLRALSERPAGGAEGDALAALARAPLQRYAQLIEAAGPLFSGASVTVPLDNAGAAMDVTGEDVRLSGPLARVFAGEGGGDDVSALGRQAQSLSARLDGALARFSALNDRVAAHLSLLDTLPAELRAQVNPDLDAEGARMAALNVRQGLAGESAAIANAAPRAILGFFRE